MYYLKIIDNDGHGIHCDGNLAMSISDSEIDSGDDAANGTQDGGDGQAVMTDSGESFTVNAFVGFMIHNETDGSSGIITANDATTVTATLTGGTDNDWDD